MILEQSRETGSILQQQLNVVYKAVMLYSLVGSAVIVSPWPTEHMQRLFVEMCMHHLLVKYGLDIF